MIAPMFARLRVPTRRPTFALVAALALVLGGRAEAGFTTRIDPGSAVLAAGGSQQFTVYLDATPDTLDTEVFGFTARLELTGAVSGVQFTGGSMPGSGYIFDSNSSGFAANLGPQDPGDPFPPGAPALSITLSDFPDHPDSVILPGGGGTWVLGVVTVTADPNAVGGAVQVRFNRDYSDVDGNAPLELRFQDATLQVQGTGVSPAPAPAGLVLIATGSPFLALWVRRGGRSTRPVGGSGSPAKGGAN